MNDLNFATAFRPKTFAEVVGQDVPKSVLKKVALAEGVVVRSIFLKGAYGSGKSTLVRLLGKAFNCSKFKELGDVCNECDGCKDAATKNSQNYLEFDSSVAGNIESIRALQEKLSYLPKGRRVVVFDECHAASKSALNALLKLVEDGVPNTLFVFASTEDILPTIKSRSLCLEVTPIPFDLIKQRVYEVAGIQGIEINDEVLDLIAVRSGGHMRDALSLLQLYSLSGIDGIKSSYSLVVKFFKAAVSKHKEIADSTLNEILTFPVVDIKNSLYLFIKNCFVAQPNSALYPFVQSGLANKIFSYTFSPVSQFAIKDEVGIELYFRSFIEKTCNGR